MHSLVEVLEDAVRRSAYEVVLGSTHATVFTTPWGRELERRTIPGSGLFELLSEVISDEQQIELAVGNAVELGLEAADRAWTLRAKSGTEGITIFATCPTLAEVAAEAARARAEDPDAPLPRGGRPSSSSIVRATNDSEASSETSGQPFHEVWRTGDEGEEDGAPVYVEATESSVQGLPRFDELAPEDARVLVPEAWVQAEELAKAARERKPLTPSSAGSSGAARHEPDQLHAQIANQARTITGLQLELAQTRQELAQYKGALSRHDRAIRQLHKRLLSLEGQGESRD